MNEAQRRSVIHESQGAPGPWGYFRQGPRNVRLKRDHWEVGSTVTEKGVALVFGDDETNARLIAESPQLFALLKELVDIEGPQPGNVEWFHKVQAAIAKVEGR